MNDLDREVTKARSKMIVLTVAVIVGDILFLGGVVAIVYYYILR